ncbi:Fructose-bisphosphate aldolase class 2 [uncultured archaeon]|nr:Fructose-bisphosphate aldolase class 2 [uncultured archaeon]
MLVNTKKMLLKAQEEGYAVGHFNSSNLETTKAIIEAAVELNSPVIVATSKSAIEYYGLKEIYTTTRELVGKLSIPVALHLDHGPDYNLAKKCLNIGYTSVMIDTSKETFKKNVQITKKVVKYARELNASVEAEIGRLKGIEDQISSKEHVLTQPNEALEFVKATDCDSLAIAIGTSHGAYKFKGKTKLDFERLKNIRELVKIPLVLHGASSVYQEEVKKLTKYGGSLKNAHGVSDYELKRAIGYGICKINTDTDLRIAFDMELRKFLKENKSEIDVRKILGNAYGHVKEIVEKKIKIFGSEGKAY